MNFATRHIGSNTKEQDTMLHSLGYNNLDDFINFVVPNHLLSHTGITSQDGLSEYAALQKLNAIMSKNKLYKNYIGMGYSETITPSVIKRNVFENPGWYTAYTPYQAEISQGRLEALLNYQQMVMDLTGFNLANASLLDEATAAAEAMLMAFRINHTSGRKFFVDTNVLPQTLEVIKTRAKYAEIEVITGEIKQCEAEQYFGVFIQNPNVYGQMQNYTREISSFKIQQPNLVVIMACDILSLVLFISPQTQGADIAIGNTQRFGIPLGFGGPAAAYIATKDEYRRLLPGRVIGVSVDSHGKKALRMALQTREQHIRREKATSNICTSQVLLANMAGFYAVYYGATGLRSIATKIHYLTLTLKDSLLKLGFQLNHHELVFDTLSVVSDALEVTYQHLLNNGYLVGKYKNTLLISLGETTGPDDIVNILSAFVLDKTDKQYLEIKQEILNFKLNSTEKLFTTNKTAAANEYEFLYRQDPILTNSVFNQYHTETKMMRYLKSLENKDISLVHSMIPLGSCTMKLNAASELEPLSWPSVANIHPFAPRDTVTGYLEMIDGLREQLKAITGFADVSMQPNSGAQGEYAGLLAIRRYQDSIGQKSRNICLIPKSAHGTNPATAHMTGLEVVMVNCDEQGNVDVADLEAKATQYKPFIMLNDYLSVDTWSI
jgi:glycine dehydrogenase